MGKPGHLETSLDLKVIARVAPMELCDPLDGDCLIHLCCGIIIGSGMLHRDAKVGLVLQGMTSMCTSDELLEGLVAVPILQKSPATPLPRVQVDASSFEEPFQDGASACQPCVCHQFSDATLDSLRDSFTSGCTSKNRVQVVRDWCSSRGVEMLKHSSHHVTLSECFTQPRSQRVSRATVGPETQHGEVGAVLVCGRRLVVVSAGQETRASKVMTDKAPALPALPVHHKFRIGLGHTATFFVESLGHHGKSRPGHRSTKGHFLW